MPGALLARSRRAAGLVARVGRGAALTGRDSFVTSAPSPQTAIDAAPDSWASRFPPPLEDVQAGSAELFEDPRVSWAIDRISGVSGASVLDLGPLEGAHSYMAERAGARRVVGVEANRAAFLKCLVTKELLDLQNCSFRCGDVVRFLETTTEEFDVCIACGILYHMVEPVQLIDLISRHASRLILWTHVYDEVARANRNLAGKLSGPSEVEYDGFRHQVYRHSYGLDARLTGFFGGVERYSTWLPREELFRALRHFGWTDLEVGFDEPAHPNGPSLALVASQKR
jgi:Protein of unknown function (DUF1698)